MKQTRSSTNQADLRSQKTVVKDVIRHYGPDTAASEPTDTERTEFVTFVEKMTVDFRAGRLNTDGSVEQFLAQYQRDIRIVRPVTPVNTDAGPPTERMNVVLVDLHDIPPRVMSTRGIRRQIAKNSVSNGKKKLPSGCSP